MIDMTYMRDTTNPINIAEAYRLAALFPDRKIQAIKELRAFSNMGLQDAKDMIESAAAGTLRVTSGTLDITGVAVTEDERLVVRTALEFLAAADRSPIERTIAARILCRI